MGRTFFSALSAAAAAAACVAQTANTELLIYSDVSTNAASVTAFTDDGNEGHTLTPSGGVQHDSAEPKVGDSSIYFNGTGYIQIADNASMEMGRSGASDWCVEFWIKFPAVPTAGYILTKADNSTDYSSRLYFTGSALQFIQKQTGVPAVITYSRTFNPTGDTWYHICYERNGYRLYGYIDGVIDTYEIYGAVGYWYGDGGMDDTSYDWFIGKLGGSASNYLNAWISEFRLVIDAHPHGGAGANFTPSTTAFTSDANTALLIHSDELAATNLYVFTDLSSNGATVTRGVDTQHDSGVAGPVGSSSSILFTSGDYLTVPDSANIELGSGDFTLEAWVRVPDFSGAKALFSKADSGSNTASNSFTFSIDSTVLRMEQPYAWGLNSSAHGMSVDTWHHVCLERSGSTYDFYVDGALISTHTHAGNFSNGTAVLMIGKREWDTAYNFAGNMQGIEMTIGARKYGTAFAKPPSPTCP